MSTENTHYGPEAISRMLCGKRSIFFIGIGGINMSSLAHITKKRGYRVGGSDRTESALTERLAETGIEIFTGHDEKHLDGYDAVVYTVAISPDNPEYRYALERGLPVISRADYLGYVMTGYRNRIGIAGMHGKSSCTSMCATAFLGAKADPTVLSGAELDVMGGAYCVGSEEHFIFEACEYMDSFLDFSPTVAVVLNVEMDHVDYFHSMEQIRTSFLRYVSLCPEDGWAVYNGDDAQTVRALAPFEGKRLVFSLSSPDADVRAEGLSCLAGRYSFDVVIRGECYCHVALSVSGVHHVYNALAAAAVSWLCGLAGDAVGEALSAYRGAKRRMEYRGRLHGADVYDDYGHHPTEVRTTLSGAKSQSEGRLFCVFQPHTYSRTKALLSEFSESFESADRVILVDIYAAREKDTMGVNSAILAEKIGPKARYAARFEDAAELLLDEVKKKDTVVVMGAGDVYRLFPLLPLEDQNGM